VSPFPHVEEGTSYGTLAFRVKGKLAVRQRQDGKSVVLRSDFSWRESLMERDPVTFFITDHYRNHPWVLINMDTISELEFASLFEAVWKEIIG